MEVGGSATFVANATGWAWCAWRFLSPDGKTEVIFDVTADKFPGLTITGGNVYWNQSMLWYRDRQQGWSDMEWMIRDWVNWKWLSGDHIVEQHVHNIDVFLWMSGMKPVKATAFGARHRRITGDQYDQFSVDFEFENGIHLHSMCRQIDGCSNNIGEYIQGTLGSWNSYSNEIKDLAGNVIWKFDEEAAKAAFQQHNPYVLEHVDWVNHIRKGEAHDEAEECDASPTFKQTYIDSSKDDIEIIASPVGMPGRAIGGEFIRRVKEGLMRPKKCPFHCIKTCDYTKSPYCIIMALYNAAKGNLSKGYAFCGANAYMSKKITSVRETIESLKSEFAAACRRNGQTAVL